MVRKVTQPASVGCLLIVMLLSGCFGGDDDPRLNGEGSTSGPEDGTGSVTGRVLTVGLDEVANARVSLVSGAELVQETRTQADGSYELHNVEPGEYRLQVTAACCREAVQGVEVVEGETVKVDLQLEPFTTDDLREPYIEQFEWTGMIGCGIGTPVIAGELCGTFDESAEASTIWEIHQGLKTVTATLDWTPTGGVLGEELQMGMFIPDCGTADNPCSVGSSSEQYGHARGAPPVPLRVDDPGGALSFETIDGTREVQWMVLPVFEPDVYYQQEFTVYYHVHYHAPAPEGYDPLPDL